MSLTRLPNFFAACAFGVSLCTAGPSFSEEIVISAGALQPEDLIKEHIAASAMLDLPEQAKMSVVFNGSVPEDIIDLDVLNFDQTSGRFAGRFFTETGNIVLRGRVDAAISAYVPSRRISAGDIISEGDLVRTDVPIQAVKSYALREQSALLGKEAKRTLMPGRLVAENAVIAPRVILRGENVTISYAKGGLDLTAPGRALQDGGINEHVRVVNLHSSKTISAEVIGEGFVQVRPAHSTQIIEK